MQNQLKKQTSPYLLQHADNPVAWYPWCEEAFERAKKEDKPVFLSIGYSTCHWCHVMAHESFEDEQVAEILNQYFVSIKVDKEERPDIDSIYMAVCQAFTGSGGWPTPHNLLFLMQHYEKTGDKEVMNMVEKTLLQMYRGGKGFLDDYAFETFALLHLYKATLDEAHLEKAQQFCKKAIADFYDEEQGGFFLYGKNNVQLIIRPKETYDGAVFIFSGNSAMAYNLVQLYELTGEEAYKEVTERQLHFLIREAGDYPAGHAMFLMTLSDFIDSPMKITVVVKENQDLESMPCKIPLDAVVCDGTCNRGISIEK